MKDNSFEAARRTALDQVDRNRRTAWYCMIGAGVFEAVTLVAALVVADFSNKTHLLIFLCACMVYCPLIFGLLSIKAALRESTGRLLQGLEQLSAD